MAQARDIRTRIGQRRTSLALAAIAIIAGVVLIYVANNVLTAGTLGQAFAAYVGVFVAAGGILYGALTWLSSE